MIKAYAQLIRLEKPVGFLLLLCPTLWGLWVASNGPPPLNLLFIFTAGAFITRSAGCVINDLVDIKIDCQVSRTQYRPLVTGKATQTAAYVLLLCLSILALSLVLWLNYLTLILSLGALVLMTVYPFCKRFTYWPQAVLGIAFGGWPILMAFAARLNHLPLIAYKLFFIASLWPLAYDTLYAMADREDDKKIGIKSSAIRLGNLDRYFVAIIQITMLILLATLGRQLNLKSAYPFYLSLLVSACLAGHQQYQIRNRNPQACLQAFNNNSIIGLIMFLGLYWSY